MRFLPALPAAAAVTAVAAVLSGCEGPGQIGTRPAGRGAGLGVPAAPPSAGPAAPPIAPSGAPVIVPSGVPGASPRQPGTFTLVASGDVLLHDSVSRQARADGGGQRDYRAIMASIKPVVAGADLALCHLETPLGAPDGPFTGHPVFSVPPEIAPALADLGYDSCSTASDHTLDKGEEGIARTLQALDRSGIRHAGSARTPAEAMTPAILRANGVPVAQLAYAYGFNGHRVPKDKPWLANQISTARILADARRARRAGAKVVVVSMHWGAEYEHDPTSGQIELARTLLASRAIDLIVGHHVHVVQPFGQATNGKWVVYGLGNLVANQGRDAGARHEGMIARFTFAPQGRRWRVISAELVPTFIDRGPPYRLVNVTAALADPALDPTRRAQLAAVAQRTHTIARSRGTEVTLAR